MELFFLKLLDFPCHKISHHKITIINSISPYSCVPDCKATTNLDSDGRREGVSVWLSCHQWQWPVLYSAVQVYTHVWPVLCT